MVMTSETIEAMGKVARTIDEVAGMTGEATRVTKEILEAPKKYMGVANKAIEMVEAIYGAVMVVDQATSRIHEDPCEASDGHSGNARDVTMST